MTKPMITNLCKIVYSVRFLEPDPAIIKLSSTAECFLEWTSRSIETTSSEILRALSLVSICTRCVS